MDLSERRLKTGNSLQLLLNTLVLGVASCVSLQDPRIIPIIEDVEYRLPRYRLPLRQVADALRIPEAQSQLTDELQKLVFRSCVADAFEVAERFVVRAHKDHIDELPWYWYGKAIRNALRHGFRISVREKTFQKRLPLTWRKKKITAQDDGAELAELFDFSDGIQLILDMRSTVVRR